MFNEVALSKEMKMSIMYANVDEVKQFFLKNGQQKPSIDRY